MSLRIVAPSLLQDGHARLLRVAARVLLLAGLCAGPTGARAAKWEPVAPADLEAKESAAFPGADAEVLLSTYRVEERGDLMPGGRPMDMIEPAQMETERFFRAKIYTAAAAARLGAIEAIYPMEQEVSDVAARVLHPDGTSRELSAEEIENCDTIGANGAPVRRLKFRLPSPSPGDMFEFRLRTIKDKKHHSRFYEMTPIRALHPQESMPVREFRFSYFNHVGSAFRQTLGSARTPRMFISWANCPDAEVKYRPDGGDVVMRKLPAFEPETLMPAQLDHRVWLSALQIHPEGNSEAQWAMWRTWMAERFANRTAPDAAIRAKCAELLQGAKTDDEKLRRLYDFCQEEILNFRWDDSAEALAAKQDPLKETKQWQRRRYNRPLSAAPEVLAARAGGPNENTLLFAALARAAGYRVQLWAYAPKSQLTHIQMPYGFPHLSLRTAGVEVGGVWRCFSPGDYLVPYGMIDRRCEGASAYRCDGKKGEFIRLPVGRAESSQLQRKGRFTLLPDGTLQGEVEETYTGHLAMERKERYWRQDESKAAADFMAALVKRLPGAEVEALSYANLHSRKLPLAVRYRVVVRNFAACSEGRLAFAPSYFASGQPALFVEPQRKYPIQFPYAWQEHDDIEIVLPDGFDLDNARAPAVVGDGGKALGASYRVEFDRRSRVLTYRRDFVLGGNCITTFRAEAYPSVQRLFEELHNADAQAIRLKATSGLPN